MDIVRWLPWGVDAFARARAENRPVLLSITTVWCEACQEMYRTSYADPLVAPSAPHGGTFTMPTNGVRERLTNVPRFVTVRGGAYFLLPGLAARRYLAGLR